MRYFAYAFLFIVLVAGWSEFIHAEDWGSGKANLHDALATDAFYTAAAAYDRLLQRAYPEWSEERCDAELDALLQNLTLLRNHELKKGLAFCVHEYNQNYTCFEK